MKVEQATTVLGMRICVDDACSTRPNHGPHEPYRHRNVIEWAQELEREARHLRKWAQEQLAPNHPMME